LVAERRAGRLR